MLVPSPSEDVKALIGDKNADETSDLSEISDNEQQDDGEDVIEVNTKSTIIKLRPEALPEIVDTQPKSEASLTEQVVKEIANDNNSNVDPERMSLISMDTSNPNVVTEATNDNLVGMGVKNPFMGSTDRLLNELTVDVNHSITDEDFNSIISPTQVYEHRQSIDRLFEAIVTDDNNNTDKFEWVEEDWLTEQEASTVMIYSIHLLHRSPHHPVPKARQVKSAQSTPTELEVLTKKGESWW